MGLKGILLNIRDRGLQDVLDPKVRAAYSEWNEIKKNGLHLDADEIFSFCEQVVYRSRKCEDCLERGDCRICHCPTPELFCTPLAHCKEFKWDDYKSPEEWEEFKKTNNVKIFVV